MTLEDLTELRADLRLAEEVRRYPYDDASGLTLQRGDIVKGKITIGVGRNLSDRGLTAVEIDYLLDNDIAAAVGEISLHFQFRKFDAWSSRRQRAFAELVVNMGMPRLLGFHKMMDALAREDWATVAAELLDSKWRHDVGESRAQRIARYLRDG